MATITSYGELQAKLKKIRNKALEGAAGKSTKLGKEVIQRDIYDADSPESYERTYDLKNSLRDNPIENGMGSQAVVVIDHDTAMINPNLDKYQHGSPMSGSVAGMIPKIVHDGLSGGMFGDGYWRLPRFYTDTIKTELNAGKYRRFMIEEIKAMGIKVK